MNDTTPITITGGTWYTRENGGAFEIINHETNEPVALVNEPGDAAIISCTKEMLETLIRIQEIASFPAPDGTPIPKHFLEEGDIDLIAEVINNTFGKIANEVPA